MSDDNKPQLPLTAVFTILCLIGTAFFGYLNLKGEKSLGAKEVEVKRWEEQKRQDKLDKDIHRASSEAYGK